MFEVQANAVSSQEQIVFKPKLKITEEVKINKVKVSPQYADPRAGFHISIAGAGCNISTQTSASDPNVSQEVLLCAEDKKNNISNRMTTSFAASLGPNEVENVFHVETSGLDLENIRRDDVKFRYKLSDAQYIGCKNITVPNQKTPCSDEITQKKSEKGRIELQLFGKSNYPQGTDYQNINLKLDAQIKDPSNNTWHTLNTLDIHVLPPRKYDVYLHFVTETQNGSMKSKETPAYVDMQGYKSTLQAELNKIFRPMNVTFEVMHQPGRVVNFDSSICAPQTNTASHANADRVTEYSGYDVNGNGVFDVNPNDTLVSGTELNTLLSDLVPGAICTNTTMSNTLQLMPVHNNKRELHLFFMDELTDSANSKNIRGVAIYGYSYVFVKWKLEKLLQNQVVAHEIGHALHMNHNHEANGISKIIVQQKQDTDYWDGTSLMYRIEGEKRLHIIAPNWKELNQEYH